MLRISGFKGDDDAVDGSDPNRTLIYATDDGLDDLLRAKIWAGDCSFKMCPKIFKQVLGVHAYIGNGFYPRAWCLLPNQNQKTYERAFGALKNLGIMRDINTGFSENGLGITPELMLLDFELAENVDSLAIVSMS